MACIVAIRGYRIEIEGVTKAGHLDEFIIEIAVRGRRLHLGLALLPVVALPR